MKRAKDFGRLMVPALWQLRNRRVSVSPGTDLPRLFVDVSVIARHDAQTGIQRVVRAVWSELVKRHGQGFELVPVHASRKHGYCYAPLDFLSKRGVPLPTQPVRVTSMDVFLGLDLSAQFLPTYRRQLRAWRAAGVRVNLVVYDLLPIIRPDFFNERTVFHFQRWFKVLAEQADQAICISRQVGCDLRERLRKCKATRFPEISYLELGGDISASQPSTGVCENIGQLLGRMRFRPTILMVGTVEPRKGYDVALAAFEHLWRTQGGEAPDLVIVGKPGWKTEPLQRAIREHSEHGRRLHWLDQVSDEDLCSLYETSRGLLMTSHAEGFGLPLLEAVTHQRQVLARDLPVFREQNLPNVLFFQDDRPEVLGTEILALSSAALRNRPSTTTLPSWSESVDKLLLNLQLGGVADPRSDQQDWLAPVAKSL